MSGPDPFHWDVDDEDLVRARCECGWTAPWRDYIKDVRADERDHVCAKASAWRSA